MAALFCFQQLHVPVGIHYASIHLYKSLTQGQYLIGQLWPSITKYHIFQYNGIFGFKNQQMYYYIEVFANCMFSDCTQVKLQQE